MRIYACPKCGSTNISQGTLGEGVLTGYVNRDVCKDCGYQGMPIIFDSQVEYKKFLEGLSKDKESTPQKYLNKSEKPTKKEKTIRPVGLTILSVIMILQSIFVLILYYNFPVTNTPLWLWIYYAALFIIDAVLLPYGFLKARPWAWTLGAILFALSIPIGLIYLYYLTRPHVKKYFGKT